MNLFKVLLAAAALAILAACGGGDTEDRLDVADPKVRFVDIARSSANVTLYRNDVGQSDANNVGYKYASPYFDVSPGNATWSIRLAANTATQLADVSFDADRGDRNTIVAIASDSGTEALLIRDPYNKGLTSDKARVRVLNGAVNVAAIDVYITEPGRRHFELGARLPGRAGQAELAFVRQRLDLVPGRQVSAAGHAGGD